MAHDCAFLQDLSLTAQQVSFEPEKLAEFSTDYGTTEEAAQVPDAVVWPETTADVAAVLAAANERGTPVTPYAAGSSTESNAVPAQGGITLSMTQMDSVRDFRPGDMQVDVEPGMIGDTLNEYVGEEGLFVPAFPQSAAFSTIGGMIANDASGIRTVKYGEVSDWVLGLEVVLADGTVTELGSNARKTSAGYNLQDLFVGSEGTLGVITRATLDLAVKPKETVGGQVTFETLTDATAAISEAIHSGIDVATIELIDSLTAEIASAYAESGLPVSPMIFFEIHGRCTDAELEALREVFEAHNATQIETSKDDDEMAALWRARREIGHALKEWDPNRELETVGDITVPIGSYSEMISFIGETAAEYDLPIPAFGHAGDGNAHYAILCDRDDAAELERAREASKQIIQEAIDHGGTCTGEHGIGLGKREYLQMEQDASALETMQRIKQTLDPNGILNPGKIFE